MKLNSKKIENTKMLQDELTKKIFIEAKAKEEKREKARAHWAKLRKHIMEMRKKANYFVMTLDEADEA